MPDDKSEATAEAEAVLRLLESSEGSTETVMEGFASTVKKSGIIRRASASEVIDMMHSNSNHGKKNNVLCLDARTPKEYDEGCIPGALNLPLFSNEERVIVGTLFKNSGRGKAMTVGMEIVRPKFDELVSKANALMKVRTDGGNSSKTIIVHCWRGGMRSHALAYLLQARGSFDILVLTGGYKAFRNWARLVYCYIPVNASYTFDISRPNTAKHRRELQREKAKSKKAIKKKEARLHGLQGDGAEKRRLAMARRDAMLEADDKAAEETAAVELTAARAEWSNQFPNPTPRIVIVGGRSGSGKTRVLLALRDELGQQIVDLEGLANHNGSAFGFVGHGEQPTNEQYSNIIAVEWSKLDPNRIVFIEDEGPGIGRVSTPAGLYSLMRTTPSLVRLVVPQAARIAVLLHDYTSVADKDNDGNPSSEWRARMSEGARSLTKRIGDLKLKSLLWDLENGDYAAFAATALSYYDGLYDNHIQNAGGCGNGAGIRSATAVDIIVDPSATDVDGEKVGRQVLEAVAFSQLDTK